MSTLLKGLKKYPFNLSVIVSSWDDGGSNGRIRKEYNAFPYSDIRQCLVALAKKGKWKDYFQIRYSEGELAGHTAANLFLANLEKITKSVEEPINIAREILGVKAQVLPATLTPATLSAVLENAKKISGEHKVDSPQAGKFSRIKLLKLTGGKINPKAVRAITSADVLVFGPGDLYTSVLPNLLAPGLKKAVLKSKAKKIFVGNLMTKNGQTNGFKASDFIWPVLKFVPDLGFAIFNKQQPPKNLLQKYSADKSEMVELDKEGLKKTGVNIILEDLLESGEAKKARGDILKRSFLRHNSEKLAKLIWNISRTK